MDIWCKSIFYQKISSPVCRQLFTNLTAMCISAYKFWCLYSTGMQQHPRGQLNWSIVENDQKKNQQWSNVNITSLGKGALQGECATISNMLCILAQNS